FATSSVPVRLNSFPTRRSSDLNLGIGIANYVSLFDPEVVILGGGVSKSFQLVSEQLIDIIRQHTPQRCEVVQTTLGEEAGIIGAVALFLEEHDLPLNI